jgi:hypothetical protein
VSEFFLGAFIGFLVGWGLEYFRMRFRMRLRIQSSLDDLEKLKAHTRRDKAMGRLV